MRELARLLAASRDERFIHGFLRQLLTPDEYAEIGSRWRIVRLLRAGMTQREIAARLGVSLCKITRGSRELKKKDGPLARIPPEERISHVRRA